VEQATDNGVEMPAKHRLLVLLAVIGIFSAVGAAHGATVVALGASNTYGKGVSPGQAYPAQLQALLRARGLNVQVINAGINGDTTAGMLARLDQAVPRGTSVVVFQPGGNDLRQRSPDQSSAIESRLSAMGIRSSSCQTACCAGCPTSPTGYISRRKATTCWLRE